MACVDVSIIDPKRSGENVPIRVDWHDYLASQRARGADVALNTLIRLPRRASKGVQYRATTDGTTSGVPTERLRWPATIGATLTDGSVVWTAEAMSSGSLRTTISADDWPAVTGLTLGAESNADMVYQVMVDGGVSGQTYDLVHRITCADGTIDEQLIRLPVED